jgi:hypothetical protein
MDIRKCPECGVENPVSRATCQVCHAPMMGKKDQKGSVDPFVDKTSPVTEPQKEKKPRGRPKTDIPIKDKKEEPPKAKRRARRKSKISEPTFLILQDGKLQVVNIRIAVKAIKPKEVRGVERNLITIWNRNKDLFTD